MPNIQLFLDYLRYEKRNSPNTFTAYENDLKQFVSFGIELSEDFSVENADHHLIRQWIISLMDQKVTSRSVNRKISTLKSYYKFLMRQGIIDHNPTERVIVPRMGKKLPVFVQEREINDLLDMKYFSDDFQGRRDKAIISLFYGTGIRLSELKNIRFQDLDIKGRMVKVLGKRNKERLVPFPFEMAGVLKDYLELRNELFGEESNMIFLTEKGEPVYVKLIYRIVNKYLGFVTTIEQRSPHILRHSYATHLLNRGADLNAIKELLGHSNLAATQIYSHTTFEELKKIYKRSHPRG